VDLIACEDTRRTRALLTHFDIHTPTVSYWEKNQLARGRELVRALADGRSVALVTDAGTPSISDPGFRLVREARGHGIPVVPVPGPSAVVAALSAAGIPADRFVFDGFLPVKPGRRLNRLKALRELETTVVLYESPYRILATLEAVGQVFGEVEFIVARELTKVFEEMWRGTLAGAVRQVERTEPRGEHVVVVGPAPERAPPGDAEIEAAVRAALADGRSARDAASDVADALGVARRRAYEAATRLKPARR